MAGMKEGEVIESGMLTRQIEKAQRKVEAHNFDVRKQLLMFDDVANDQRKVVYQQRTELMGTDDLGDAVRGIRAEVVSGADRSVSADERQPRGVESHRPDRSHCEGFLHAGGSGAVAQGSARARGRGAARPHSRRHRCDVRRQGGAHRHQPNGVPIMRHIEKDIMLKVLDQHWRDHLGAMDYLRQGIHLRGYAQKDYRYEYKREAFELFAAMLERVKFDTVTILATLDVQIKSPEQIEREEEARRARLNRALQMQHAEAASLAQLGAAGEPAQPQAAASGGASGRAADAPAWPPSSTARYALRPRSAATSRAPAAAARNSRTATACSKASNNGDIPRFLANGDRPHEAASARGRRSAV